ncbi:hydrogen gas-evolving membrane-bound hydrogenase subunit E [Rhodosalinus sp. 5P4]|uniref:hydrogen gas-evolving membrane-bound hydrogenase subunit E n=1 Tax=Rhodosalinus sp. 5P4 TaxID=3239196 RepID=UPI003525FF79
MAGAETSGKPAGNGAAGVLPILLAAGLFAVFMSTVPDVARGEVLRWQLDWVPSLGISLGILLDGLALTFALLISGIGTLVLLYSNTYLAGHAHYDRFALYLTSFMLSMLGLVLADDLITLFVFWELTTLTSYLLIGFSHEQEGARRNALQALLVTAAGGLAFLAGLILLGFAAGTTSLAQIVTQGEDLKAHALYLPILVLILIGAFTKSAQVPFHFWLPNAMAAPTPVSAFLHSATMVKAGVYVMARLHPPLSGTDVWLWTLTIFGAVTAVYASILALRQTDLKQALAYTTLMALGTLTLFLGQESGYAMTAFATFLVVHSLYKAALFLVVGCMDKATGTREADLLGGLGRAMPVTAVAAAVAAMSMAGFPPLLGFISKELKYAGALAVASEPVLVAGSMLLSNALMMAVAGVVALRPFWSRSGEMPRTPREAPWQMLAGPVILAGLGALFGLQPDLLQQALVQPTVVSLTGEVGEVKPLQLWAGINMPLILSIATFALGIVLYLAHRSLRRGLAAVFGRLPSLDAGWDRLLDGLKALAGWQTGIIQNGQLGTYLAATFATILAGLVGTMLWAGLPEIAPAPVPPTWQQAAIAALILAGAALAMVTNSRIAAIAGLGAVGIGVALVFILYGAPDVAITQLLVETLVVVLLAVVMLRLPALTPDRFRAGHAALAAGLGASVTLIVLAVLTVPFDRRLTEYFEAASWPEAFGRNIVNVILVDFRALDTFGEIAVVVIAALSAYALLRQSGKGAEK